MEVLEESEQLTTVSLNSEELKARKPRHESAILGDSLEGSSTFRSPEDKVNNFMKEPAVDQT